MDTPAERSTRTAGPQIRPAVREAGGSRRRRPSGEPPPLPHHLQTSGIRWLVAMLVLVVLAIVVFAGGLRGIAVDVAVADAAVVGWLAGIDLPGFRGLMRGLAALSSFWVLNIVSYALVLVLLVLRRFRHMIIWLILTTLLALIGDGHPRPGHPAAAAVRGRDPGGLGRLGHAGDAGHLLRRRAGGDPVLARARGPLAQHRQVGGDGAGRAERPRPDGAGRRRPDRRAGRGGPRGDDPAGRLPLVHAQRGLPDHLPGRAAAPTWTSAGPRGRRSGAAWRTSSAWSPPRSSRSACPARPAPPRCGSPSSGDPPAQLFGKLYARSHLRSDRWYKLGRELLYGRLEDEKPFNTVRRLVQQEDYALSLMRRAGLPSPDPLRVRRAHPRTRVPAGHRVLRRRHRARRGRGRRRR